MKNLCYPEVHLPKFDKMVLDGKEWRIIDRESEDSFLLKEEGEQHAKAVHVDTIYRKMVMSDHVEFIKEN